MKLEVLDSLLHALSKRVVWVCTKAFLHLLVLLSYWVHVCLNAMSGAIFCQNGRYDVSVTDVRTIEDEQ